jgi:hypothetical protein
MFMPDVIRSDSSESRDKMREGPYSFNEVLLCELQHLRPDAADGLTGEPYEDPSNRDLDELTRAENLRLLFDRIGKLDRSNRLSALCFSGGGIRSATFNLGVLQALARAGVLDQFDYLSTVSGGGYVGGWLKAWMQRVGTRPVLNQLTNLIPEIPFKPEPRPVDRLREYSNYLTPRGGLVSGDSWAAAAIIIRNLLLNWMIVVPVLLAALAAPQLYALLLQLSDDNPDVIFARGTWLIVVAIVLELAASIAIHRFRRPRKARGAVFKRVMWFGILPLVVSASFLAIGAEWLTPAEVSPLKYSIFAALWCVLIPLFGWAFSEPFWRLDEELRWPWQELLALIVSGLLTAALLTWSVIAVYPRLAAYPVLYAIFAVPLLLGLYLISRTIFVALSDGFTRTVQSPGIVGHEDADKEWWARLSGYVLKIALVWVLLTTLSLLGWYFAVAAFDRYALPMLSGIGGVTGLVSVIIGKSGSTGSGRDGATDRGTRMQRWSLATAAPLFCIVVFVLLAHAYEVVGRFLTEGSALPAFTPWLSGESATGVSFQALVFYALPSVAFVILSALASRVVNINRFSLHGLYRNRLVRAYLGASNPRRSPDPFTGFDFDDNLKMASLWREPAHPGDVDCQRPLLVVNTTLNLVRGARLAWQERKAESFSMSPFFCGNFYEGYRSSAEYGGRRGLTLGTAMTISGAAANPNMGYHSSPSVTFLLGLFNARLGAWLGNTNFRGNKVYKRSGPREAVWPLFAELFGWTDAESRFVQLSDGGHFENIGIYEMVMRRCRFIVVGDAGQDPGFGFEDLGNAIRKIRIDFGVPIVFEKAIKLVPPGEKPGVYCAVGEIRYSETDGHGVTNGTIVYIKPTLNAVGTAVPYDVYSYARQSKAFPHEPTSDQWFSESQFESYRALGMHAMSQITASMPAAPSATLMDLEKAASSMVDRAGLVRNSIEAATPEGTPPAP